MSYSTSMRPEFKGVLGSQLSRQLQDEPEANYDFFGFIEGSFGHHVVPTKIAALRHVQQVEEQLTRARANVHHQRQTLAHQIAELNKALVNSPSAVDVFVKAFKAEPHPGIEDLRAFLTRHPGVKAKTQAEEVRSSEFEPSPLLTGHLVEGLGTMPAEAQRQVASKLRDLVMGMLQSIADAHVYAGKTEPYRISVGQKFVRSITRAIQSRLDIDPYEERPFLYQLHRELEAACPLKVDDWSLELAADGSLSLSVAQKTNRKRTRDKAQIVRMRFGKRGTLANE